MPFFSGFASFSMQISDDERMSLTTAISDDEIDRSSSPVSTRPINSAASFNCTGAVRKAGFLSVKKWLIRKKHKVRPQQCSSSETWSLKRAYVMLIRKIFSSMIPEAWIINRGWSLNTSNTRILLVFNHPVDCLVQAVYFCSGQNSKLWTMGQEFQSSKEIIMI